MTVRLSLMGSVAALVALAVTALVGGTASAIPAAGAPAGSGHVMKVGMHRAGFDGAAAREDGYTIRYGANGKPYGWKPGYVLHTDAEGNTFAAAPRTGVSPDSAEGDYAYGNCGYSFIYFNNAHDSQGFINTGYGIDQAVHEVHWVVEVSDSHGQGTVTINTGAEGRTWSRQFYTTNHLGYAEATVFEGSFVIELDGTICNSDGPTDDTTITL